jgi:hypothetical protein
MFDLERIQQSRRYEWLDSQSKTIIRALAENRDAFDAMADAHTSIIRDHITKEHTKTRELISRALNQHSDSERSAKSRVPTIFVDGLKDGSEYDATRRKAERKFQDSILQSLAFPSMQTRHFEIADAHAKTFDWIFRTATLDTPLWSDFRKWLSHGSGIYWVNGKAGSGKSTLMRYLYEDPRTYALLADWAGSADNVTTAGFFFWKSGTPEQGSQMGLLRSLLHSVLSQKPELIPSVFPERWEVFELAGKMRPIPNILPERWQIFEEEAALHPDSREFESLASSETCTRRTLAQLEQAFQRLLKQDLGHVCLFIDGLDEYIGDPMDTVNLFKLTISTNLKICLSSRPWVVFEDAFESCPKLKLQDLTLPDIQLYVNDTLAKDERMKKLCDLEPVEAPKLVDEIVTKADGVFLWVKLVVSSLLRGLNNRDQVEDLQRRVRILPSELTSLFTYMINQIEPVYQEEGMQIFLLMLRWQAVSAVLHSWDHEPQEQGFCAIDLSFALEADTKATISTPVKLLSDDDITRRISKVDSKLKVRCAGLLEIPTLHNGDVSGGRAETMRKGNIKVQWLHRTVKDYLETDEAQNLLRKHAGKSPYSPSLPLLRASVLKLKTWFLNTSASGGISPLPGLVRRTMVFAYQTECELGQPEVELLDAFDKTVQFIWEPDSKHWVNDVLGHSEPGTCDEDFLTLAIEYDLSLYLREKLSKISGGLASTNRRPLLSLIDWYERMSAVRDDPASAQSLSPASLRHKKDILELLLQRSCDPNQKFNGTAPFRNAVLQFSLTRLNYLSSELLSVWVGILELFVCYRANPPQTIQNYSEDNDTRYLFQTQTNYLAEKFPDESARLRNILPPDPVSRKSSKGKAGLWFKKRFSRGKMEWN